MSASDLRETLAVLKEYGLLERVAEVGPEVVRLHAAMPKAAQLSPIEQHERDARKQMSQAEWEQRVAFGAAGGIRPMPQRGATSSAVPASVRAQIREQRQHVRASTPTETGE